MKWIMKIQFYPDPNFYKRADKSNIFSKVWILTRKSEECLAKGDEGINPILRVFRMET
jgi:hypothetical protein